MRSHVRLVSCNKLRLDVKEVSLSSGEGLRLYVGLVSFYKHKPDAENHG